MNKILKECLNVLSPIVTIRIDDNILAVIKTVHLPVTTKKPKKEDVTMLHFDLTEKGIKIKDGFILDGYAFIPHNHKEIAYAWIESHDILKQTQSSILFHIAEVLLE